MNRKLFDRLLITTVVLMGTFALYDILKRIYTSVNNTNNIFIVKKSDNFSTDVKPDYKLYEDNSNNSKVDFPENNKCKELNVSPSNALSFYMKYLEYVARLNFVNPVPGEDNTVVIELNISKDGRVNSYRIRTTSDSKYYNKAVLDTLLLKASPFQPFIDGMEGNNIVIQFTFSGNHINNAHMASDSQLDIIVNQNVDNRKPFCMSNVKEIYTTHSFYSKDNNLMTCNSWNIQQNWAPPLTENSLTDVVFRVNKNGSKQILDVKSNNEFAKRAAIDAINNTKCKPFPSDAYKDSLDINYSFRVEDLKY